LRREVQAVPILKLQDVRQREDHLCGSAAVEVIASFYRLRCEGVDRYANPVQGMAPDTLAAVLRSLGLRVLAGQMVGGIADLQHFTRLGRPVACPITASAGGHWVVVAGVWRLRVYCQDPLRGQVSYPVSEWLDRWRDVSAETLQPFDRWGIVAARG
jgi:predicted double-glycine peptidase